MSYFVIADLHLSSDGSKSMEVFGPRWIDYQNKIEKNWRAVVSDEDTVIIPGDISWALKLEDSLSDFLFLESLPGKKLIGKGNHDFWWSTHSKMKAFFKQNGIESIDILYNNAYKFDNCIICGTRGWFLDEDQQKTVGNTDFSKIINREIIRLRIGLDQARKLQEESESHLPIIAFLHFPPVWNGFVCEEIIQALKEYGIKTCYFGHIHGAYYAPRTQIYDGIELILCAADYVNFTPIPIYIN
jgi:predicted phosphohydrolase